MEKMYCEVCDNEGIKTEASYYRDLDEKTRPLCSKHAKLLKEQIGLHFNRHYIKISENRKKLTENDYKEMFDDINLTEAELRTSIIKRK